MPSFKTGADLIAEAKTRIRLVTIADVKGMLAAPDAPRLLDVREPNETNLGRLPGATVIPRGQLETKVEAIFPRDARIVIYCASENRSSLAADTMREMGYTNVVAMAGGWGGWVASGGAVEG
jgi:rhodanese-related sulfurtransferase